MLTIIICVFTESICWWRALLWCWWLLTHQCGGCWRLGWLWQFLKIRQQWSLVALWKVKGAQSNLTLCNSMCMEFSRPEYWSILKEGSLSLLQGIFPTQWSSPGLPHCRWIFYQMSHKGNPRILEWVAYPFSSRSSRHRNQTRISYCAGGFFTNWSIREAHFETSFKVGISLLKPRHCFIN